MTYSLSRLSRRFLASLAAAFALCSSTAHAQSRIETTWDDFKSYTTAPLRWDRGDWTEFAFFAGTTAVAYQYDDDVRNHFVVRSHAAKPGKDPGSMKDFVPTALVLAGTWAGAELSGSEQGKNEGWAMFEAAGLTAFSSTVFKYAFRRERPNDTDQKSDWFKSGNSFPSMHTSLAFAVGTVLAESGNDRYRWLRRALGYGIGGATVYLRLRGNVHWLSDTVAGAGLGISTADFVMSQQDARRRRAHVQLMPTPDGGAMLMYSASLE
ncbi:MAG TPA: phosphatase PAP2 family protein [Steroidobacteraceae bacterium]|nr:phosphatase PAP2 family protein [Steroidobacteraceae bacterium]